MLSLLDVQFLLRPFVLHAATIRTGEGRSARTGECRLLQLTRNSEDEMACLSDPKNENVLLLSLQANTFFFKKHLK